MEDYKILSQPTRIVLLDNGSLRPEAVFSLRRIASSLSERLAEDVSPVSLLHSSKIDPEALGGRAADTWRQFLKREWRRGIRRFRVLPLFFGPSSAIVDYLPKTTRQALGQARQMELQVAKPLIDPHDPTDDAVARMLADLVIRELNTGDFERKPAVVLVDHGSPVRAVAECRDRVARQLERLLEQRISRVIASSMERREGEEYSFNEPLLEKALERIHQEGCEGAVLSLMFFSPGRHAGPGGDIEQIVQASAWAQAGKPLPSCALVGESPRLIDILESRYRELSDSV